MSDHPLTEEEEDEIWANSVKKWKEQKEERRLERERAIAEGRPVPDVEEREGNAWKDLPIFMNSLPGEENIHIDALQSIVDETPPVEQVDTFKSEGNDRFKLINLKTTSPDDRKRYINEAIYYYTRALDVKCDDMKRNSLCLSNRAAVHMENQAYGRAIRDCQIAIEFDPTNIKAHYRAVKSRFALSQWKQTIQLANEALKVDETNKDIIALRDKAQASLTRETKRAEERKQEIDAKHKAVFDLSTQLAARKMQLGRPLFDMSRYTHSSDRSVSIDGQGIIHFPTVFLYPEYNQSDFILNFEEGQSFGDHLDYMFPPGNTEFAHWDKERRYTIDNIEIYFQANWTTSIIPNIHSKSSTKPTTSSTSSTSQQKRWIRVKHTTNIETVVAHPDYIIPQIPLFYILCKGSKFLNKFLTESN